MKVQSATWTWGTRRILKLGLSGRGGDALGQLVPEQPTLPLNQYAAGSSRSKSCHIGGRVDFIDSAREENKTRAVVVIYLNRGRYH